MVRQPDDRPICELFDQIACYCIARGWTPVGRREFTVETFTVRINGADTSWRGIPAFHALVLDNVYLRIALVSPYAGGTIGHGLEDDAIAALRRATHKLAVQ